MCAVPSSPVPEASAHALGAREPESAEGVCLPPRPSARKPEPPPWSEPLSPGEARVALAEAERLVTEGRPGDALLHLRVVELGVPRVADRIALERGDLLLALGQPQRACEAYRLASSSLDRNVAVRGQVGAVRCLLAAGDRSGEPAFYDLLRRYPQLSERSALQYLLARAKAGWGAPQSAASLLRAIDLQEPTSSAASQARLELERLRALGVRIAPLTQTEIVERAERLLARGPIDVAAEEIERLAAGSLLRGEAAAKLHVLRARVWRLQGRWDALRAELARAKALGAPTADTARLAPPDAAFDAASTKSGAADESATDEAQRLAAEQEIYARRVRAIRGTRPNAKLGNSQLRALLDLAIAHGDAPLADEALTAMRSQKGLIASTRFDSAMRAAGLASDDAVAGLLETIQNLPQYAVPALYHHARARERAGRTGEAEAEYLRVIQLDRSENHYYAMWAQQRLERLHPQLALDFAAIASDGWDDLQSDCAPATDAAADPTVSDHASRAPPPAPPLAATTALAPAEALAEAAAPNRAQLREQAVTRLQPIAEAHGAAYPWLLRALDLIELERFADAADELSEAYMAYRDARGAPRLRSGLYAVYTDDAPPRRAFDRALRKTRLALGARDQAVLSEVAATIGDPGIALRFGSWRPHERPRAYAELVERAAREHDLDPNLLYAVMRVESIYNRRIVSFAGAVGLMQIMPSTGRRIAKQLGRDDFSVSDLLDPAVNVDLAAWYLHSLLERFDGRLPLAIASYNGGPHNVRLWMRGHHANTPLDAFLERIPFTETHRYVRRVLTHYAAYRAQRELPMTELSVSLPSAAPDPLAF